MKCLSVILFIYMILISNSVFSLESKTCNVEGVFNEFHRIVRSGYELPNAFNYLDSEWLKSTFQSHSGLDDKDIGLNISSELIKALSQVYWIKSIGIVDNKVCNEKNANLIFNIKHEYDNEIKRIGVSFYFRSGEWKIVSTYYIHSEGDKK